MPKIDFKSKKKFGTGKKENEEPNLIFRLPASVLYEQEERESIHDIL